MHVDAHVLADVAAGVEQVAADELERVLARPGAAVALGERELRRDPVGLGVDQGAVHVPQDRGEGVEPATDLAQGSVLRVVAEVRRQPALGLGQGPALALGVVGDLVRAQPADHEVLRLAGG